MHPEPLFDVIHRGDITELRLLAETLKDRAAIDRLSRALDGVLDMHQPRYVVLDFSDVANASSHLINCLLGFQRRFNEGPAQLKIVGMNELLRELLHTLHLDGGVFQLFETRAAALAAINPRAAIGGN